MRSLEMGVGVGVGAADIAKFGTSFSKKRMDSTVKTIAREISSTSGSDVTQTHSTACTANEDDANKKGGVVLWQWVLET